MEKFFIKKDYADAKLILNQLSVKTNCFDAKGKVVPAKYLVCVDDDINSAYYAVDLYYQIFQAYKYYPMILCVGGKGALSKYTNVKGETEGKKLARTCETLGVLSSQVEILDNGTNTGLNCLDIYNELANKNAKVIMCLTKRLSLRFKQTFEFIDCQYPDKVSAKSLADVVASTFYYVPDESIEDMMQIYNCKGLCKGVMLLSEIASIYDRIVLYSGTIQKPVDFEISEEVELASLRLAKKYPLKINRFCFNGFWQFIWAYYSVLINKHKIKLAMGFIIADWKYNLRYKYSR